MAYDKVIDSAALDAGMTATANAIRAKTGGSSPIAWDSADGFKAAVEGIDTEGGVELPELNNPVVEAEVFIGKEYINGDGQKKIGSFTIDDELTEQDSLISQITNALRNKAANTGSVALPELGDTAAQPTDMVAGKVLYDDDGNPVTGTLIEANEIQEKLFATSDYSFGGTPGGTVFHVSGMYNANLDGVVVRPGAGLGVRNAPTDFFGNATADQVAKGATFTSAAGLLVEGTHECEGGVELPELGDTAAQPTDIAYGKVLYDDDGNPVTGTLGDRKPGAEGRYIFGTNPRVSGSTTLMVEAESSSRASPVIHRTGATATVKIPSAAFGTATGEYVAKGKTFTSEAGLLAEGELEEIEAGKVMSAKEDITVNRNSDGTIAIYAKTNFDLPGAIVRSGAYLLITVPASAFDGILGSTDDVTIDGETLVFGDASVAAIEDETLIL